MRQQKTKGQLLLLSDVYGLGRKGDIVQAKPGYTRNFLLPQKKAVLATASTLRMRARLQEEREKQALEDKKESEALAKVLTGKAFTITTKVDRDGHMYGSVSARDIHKLLEENNIAVDKQAVQLPKPLKKLGTHSIALKLKEGVPANFTLNIHGEGMEAVEPAEEAKESGEGETFTPETR